MKLTMKRALRRLRAKLTGRSLDGRLGPFKRGKVPWHVSDLPHHPSLEHRKLMRGVDRRLETVTDPALTSTASLGLTESDWVMGIAVEGRARAYPISSLRWHHLVNDHIVSPLLVTFCARCSSGACFDPVVRGTRLIFDLFGAYRENMTMRDRQTGTVWSQITGEALVGDMLGHTLPLLPSEMVKAPVWLQRHPHSESPAINHPPSGRAEVVDLGRIRSTQNPFVVALTLNGHAFAYRLDQSPDQFLCLTDELGGEPVVVLAAPGSIPVVFSRDVSGRQVDLVLDSTTIRGGGSTWSSNGSALDGPHAGKTLTYLGSRTARWQDWQRFHPDSELRSLIPDERR